MLVYSDMKDAFIESAKNDRYEFFDDGWGVLLEHEYATAYKATLWNSDHGLCIQHFFVARSVEQAAEIAASYMKRSYDNELWPSKPSVKVRDWYTRACPTDTEGDRIDGDVTFAEYLIDLARTGDAYIYGINDSVVRQRVMAATAHVMGLEYDAVYDLWRV